MASIVVVDASLALKWVTDQDYSDVAAPLLTQWTRENVSRLAPALFVYEITNALNKYVRRGDLMLEQAQRTLQRLFAMVTRVDLPMDSSLSVTALEIAQRTNRPATYDAHYIALAQREGCELWTADERLYNAVYAVYPFVRWIGNWGSATP